MRSTRDGPSAPASATIEHARAALFHSPWPHFLTAHSLKPVVRRTLRLNFNEDKSAMKWGRSSDDDRLPKLRKLLGKGETWDGTLTRAEVDKASATGVCTSKRDCGVALRSGGPSCCIECALSLRQLTGPQMSGRRESETLPSRPDSAMGNSLAMSLLPHGAGSVTMPNDYRSPVHGLAPVDAKPTLCKRVPRLRTSLTVNREHVAAHISFQLFTIR